MNTFDRSHDKIEDTDDAWEAAGPLGNDEKFVVRAPDDVSKAVDDSLGLQPISIRLQRTLIEDLKALGQLNGLGYQPLIRQVLTRFVECEKRNLTFDRARSPAAHTPEPALKTEEPFAEESRSRRVA